jgi:hypothetical protein
VKICEVNDKSGMNITYGYYWFVSSEKFLMLFIYPKNEQDDLTLEQLKKLKSFVEQELQNA